MRSKISWLPRPPRWWRNTKGILLGAYLVAIPILPVVIMWAVLNPLVGGVWDDWWAIILAIVLYLGLGFGMIGLAVLAEGPLDRIERRLERHRDKPGDSTTQPSRRSPTAPVASVDPETHAPRGGGTPDQNVPAEPGGRAKQDDARVHSLSASQ
jgi:hypothetical protein